MTQAQDHYRHTLHLKNHFQLAQTTADSFPGPSLASSYVSAYITC